MTITLEKYASELEHFHPEINRMVRWLNDPEIVRYSEQRHKHHTYESQLAYIEDGPDVFRNIYESGKFIGTITAYIDRNNSVADVGILIGDKSVWGNGYGTEAWTIFCDSLFETGIRKIEAGCMSYNLAMIRIAKKYEMKWEGCREDHFKIDDIRCDMDMWGKFNEAV